ncbi:MAG: hypothetical protein AAFX56_09140 [Pseudomonadota bacterium]
MRDATRKLRLGDLSPAGQMVVWAARHWVHSFVNGRMLTPQVWRNFTAIGLGAVYRELGELLSILVPQDLDPAGFPAGDDSLHEIPPRLSAGEQALLELLLVTDGERQTARLDPVTNDPSSIDPGRHNPIDMVPAVRRAARAKAARLNHALHSAGHEILVRHKRPSAAATESRPRPGPCVDQGWS